MIKNMVIIAIVGLMVFQTGCDKENVDSTRPTIEIQSPQNGDEFEPGEVIEFRAVFRDNVELNTYFIEIHYNDDGHGHGRVKDTEVPFEYEMAGEFERGLREHTITLNIPIPIDAADGLYDLGVQCTDVAGNEIEVFIEIFIEDDH